MKLQDILMHPLAVVFFLHTILRRSIFYGPSPNMYSSLTNMGSYFVLVATFIFMTEQKSLVDPYLQCLKPPVRYAVFVITFLATLETTMLFLWAHTEIFLRDVCYFIFFHCGLFRYNPIIRMVFPEILIQAAAIAILTCALQMTIIGQKIQRKFNILLEM